MGRHADQSLSNNFARAGTTLRNMTRTAKSNNPEMWVPVFLDNRKAILSAAQGFLKVLEKFRLALQGEKTEILAKQIQGAHDFRRSLKDPEPRETLAGEIADVARDHNLPGAPDLALAEHFNTAAANSLVKRVLMPAALAFVMTENVRRISEKSIRGLNVTSHMNTSFLDGTAILLSDPAGLASLMHRNRDALLERLDHYSALLSHALTAIEREDEDVLRELIEDAAIVRTKMPPPRKGLVATDKSDPVRPEYLFQVPVPVAA
jgi:prephenate dehydrogenase